LETLILKAFMEGTHLAVYASIKPGSHHRLRLDKESWFLVSNVIAITEYMIQATEYGERVRRGDRAIGDIEIGKLIARALREAYRWCSRRVYPSLVIPILLYSLAISHSNTESIIRDAGKLRRSLDLVLSINKWREIKQIIDTLRGVNRNDMYKHLVASGISHLAGVEGAVTLNELFTVLGSKWPGFISVDTREYRVVVYVKKLLEYYKRYNDAENAVVALYLDMIQAKMPGWARKYVEEAFRDNLMHSRSGAKRLFELDNMFRKQGISYNEYSELLAIITSLAVYEGMRI